MKQYREKILLNPDWQRGVLFGKGRPGHPEGSIIFHIRDVLYNIAQLSEITEAEKESLELIALLHDSFKDPQISGEKSHASVAYEFARDQMEISDETILEIIKKHDIAYKIWRSGGKDKKIKMESFIKELGDDLSLYYLFFKCDNNVDGKSFESIQFFESLISEEIKLIRLQHKPLFENNNEVILKFSDIDYKCLLNPEYDDLRVLI